MSKLDVVIDRVKAEVQFAQYRFPPMRSGHEGYAVFKEEVDELWEAVKMKQGSPERRMQMTLEAIQAAAMAIRFLVDVCNVGESPAKGELTEL